MFLNWLLLGVVGTLYIIKEGAYMHQNELENESDKDKNAKALNESRFVSYITSLLHFNSINFDKKKRKDSERFCLVLDDTEGEQVQHENSINTDFTENLTLEDQIIDSQLYSNYMNLTKREREVLNLSVYHELSDTSIAKLLKITQQSVTKTKKKL